MKRDYIITTEELREKGLDLNQYCLDGSFVNVIIQMALDMAITKILELNDTFNGEDDIENKIGENPNLLKSFKKLQYRVIYNLIFIGDGDPLDKMVEDIICFDLHWGKINGFQKGRF